MLLNEHIESYILPLLQHEVQFICNKKVIKKGKLLLFSMKNFYLSFTILNDKNEPKSFEIPYPFKIITTEDSKKLLLDYNLTTLANDNPYTRIKITNIKPVKKSKFYDTVVTLDTI